MLSRTSKFVILTLGIFLGFSLSACVAATTSSPTATPLHVGALTPYLSPTVTLTPFTPATLPSPTETPAPTPTPFTYTVKKGDTMLGIAFNYGISLEQLLEANPTVQPRMLSVGTVLVIPLLAEEATPEPEPTIIPLQTREPVCYLQADGGMWCFLPVVNDQAQPVEELTGRISLFSPDGESLGSQTAYALLDILRPGETLPLAAFFPALARPDFLVQAELLTVLPVTEGDPRYLPVAYQQNSVTIAPDGLSAQFSGMIQLPGEGAAAGSIWLVGVAYNEAGKVIGARRWQVDPPCSPAAQAAGTPEPESGCTQVPFTATLYSLIPAIERIEILLEAKP